MIKGRAINFIYTYMETKVCKICLVEKELSEFKKHINQCKKCKSDYNKKWRENNKESISENIKKWKEDNLDYFTKYNQTEKEKQRKKKWRENNKKYHKLYQKENKDKIKEYQSNWYESNKESVKSRTKKYLYNKLKTDYLFKLSSTIRNLIYIYIYIH